ncbi:MAG: methylenetetrahydrofolate reductase [Pseudomonadota bacterium]
MQSSKLGQLIETGAFIVTAELLPTASGNPEFISRSAGYFKSGIAAVNVADNPHGPITSSLAGAVLLKQAGVEPVLQMVTRDRNRIALQSDILGAAALGVTNLLCLSGHHQTLTRSRASANVFDIDSFQFIAAARKMTDRKELLDGSAIQGSLNLLVGAAASPSMTPLELNMIRMAKKVAAGARFIQTQAVFDIKGFKTWLSAVNQQGLTERCALIAGVMPLFSADEAQALKDRYTDLSIPDGLVDRLRQAGDGAAQKEEGLAVFGELARAIRTMDGVRGLHILSGGKEESVPDLLAACGS